MMLETQREGAEAADDVLRRIRAVDADDEELRPGGDDAPLLVEDGRALAELVELLSVDPDRVHGARRAGACDLLGALDEAAAPALRVEAHDVVRAEALVNRPPDVRWERVPVVRLRPGHVDEVREPRLGPRVPHVTRGEA